MKLQMNPRIPIMAKTVKQLLKGTKSSTKAPLTVGKKPGVDYAPIASNDRKFIAKHELEKHADRVGNEPNGGDKTKPALDDPKNARLRGNGESQYEEHELVDEAARGVKHVVHLTYDDPSGKGTASANAKLFAPSKDHAKRYAVADQVKRGYKNVKAVSARVINEALAVTDVNPLVMVYDHRDKEHSTHGLPGSKTAPVGHMNLSVASKIHGFDHGHALQKLHGVNQKVEHQIETSKPGVHVAISPHHAKSLSFPSWGVEHHMSEEVEQIDEKLAVTPVNPLVYVYDHRDGSKYPLSGHMHLSTAASIHGFDHGHALHKLYKVGPKDSSQIETSKHGVKVEWSKHNDTDMTYPSHDVQHHMSEEAPVSTDPKASRASSGESFDYGVYELAESRKELIDHLNSAITATGSEGSSSGRVSSALNAVRDSAPSHITPHHPAHAHIQNALRAFHNKKSHLAVQDHLIKADTALRTMKEEIVNELKTIGYHNSKPGTVGRHSATDKLCNHTPAGKSCPVHSTKACPPKGVKEEAITELNKKTLASYIKKAATSKANATAKNRSWERTGEQRYVDIAPQHKNNMKTINKRNIGIDKAADKLAKEEVENLTEEKLDLAQVQYHHDRIHHHIAMSAAHDAHPDSEEHRIASNRHGRARFAHVDAAMALIAHPSRAKERAKQSGAASLEADKLSDDLKTKPLKEEVLVEKKGSASKLEVGKVTHHAQRIAHHRDMIDFHDSQRIEGVGDRKAHTKALDMHVKASNAHKKALIAIVDDKHNAGQLSNDAEGHSVMARGATNDTALKEEIVTELSKGKLVSYIEKVGRKKDADENHLENRLKKNAELKNSGHVAGVKLASRKISEDIDERRIILYKKHRKINRPVEEPGVASTFPAVNVDDTGKTI
ncbi:MAG: hypothetical protein ACHQU0_03070 [Candidatus Paceibacteria bacterium]